MSKSPDWVELAIDSRESDFAVVWQQRKTLRRRFLPHVVDDLPRVLDNFIVDQLKCVFPPIVRVRCHAETVTSGSRFVIDSPQQSIDKVTVEPAP